MGLSLSTDDINAIAKAVAREVVRELTAAASPLAIVDAKAKRSVFHVGPIEVDIDRHEATVDGKPMDLTPREFAVVAELARNAGCVLSRETLLEVAWPQDVALRIDNNRTVDVHILRIRRALGARHDRLQTIVGLGYKLSDR